MPLSWRAYRLLQGGKALLWLPAPLLLLLLLSACDYQSQYQQIKDAASGVGGVISQTYQLPPFPTPPISVTTYLPIPQTFPIVSQTQPLPGEQADICASAQWWESDIFQGTGDMIKGFTRTVFLGGLVVFATSASTSDAAIEDSAVIWVSRILSELVWGLWPLALVWVIIKKPLGALGGAGGMSVGDVLLRVFIAVVLISTPSGPLPVAYALGIPLLLTNSIFRFLVEAAASGWTNLTAYVGIFNTDGSCNGISLIPLALMAIVTSILLVIISALFILRSAMLYIYFAAAPAALVAGLFDETKHYQEEYLQGYIKLVFGLIPVGIIFLMMNAFIFAPSGGDMTISVNHLGLAIGSIFLIFFSLKSSLSGVPTMVWNKLRDTNHYNRILIGGTAKAAGGLGILGAAGGAVIGAGAIGGPWLGSGAALAATRYIWRNRDR